MSKVHTSVKIRKDGSLVLPAFVMRGMAMRRVRKFPLPLRRISISATVTQTACW